MPPMDANERELFVHKKIEEIFRLKSTDTQKAEEKVGFLREIVWSGGAGFGALSILKGKTNVR